MTLWPRLEVLAESPAHHGALDYAELEKLGLDPEDVLDFSVNGNPYGPSPMARRVLADVPLDRYPDRESLALRRALAAHLGISPSQIVVGNGIAELLSLVALAFVRPGDRVLVVGPTFTEYARTARLMGATVETWCAAPERAFAVGSAAIERRLRRLRPRLAFVCVPNNPTGQVPGPGMLAAWTRDHPETLFVVDEAYLAFARDCPSALNLSADNVLVLRSMTKDYALAGLRLGYAAGPGGIVSGLIRVRPPWNVNALAQAAGLASLSDNAHLRRSLDALDQARAHLVADLSALGLHPLPSSTHFFLVETGDGAATRASLLARGILVRDCASFGLPTFVRVATRRPEENERLVAAWGSQLHDRQKRGIG